jgi:hypothetical protein
MEYRNAENRYRHLVLHYIRRKVFNDNDFYFLFYRPFFLALFHHLKFVGQKGNFVSFLTIIKNYLLREIVCYHVFSILQVATELL